MLNRRTLLASVPALALLSHAALAQDAPTKLQELMGELNRSMRSLKDAGKDEASLAAALETVRRLQHVVLDAKSEEPPLLADVKDPKKQKRQQQDYVAKMQQLVQELFDAENAILAGDTKAFDKAMRAMNETKKAGHDEFKPK
ncbi:MAG: hypothetical protein H6828_06735 [Planctomycetes bacterium]|nr:hypothetical protein [Planctomycetota bacterium]